MEPVINKYTSRWEGGNRYEISLSGMSHVTVTVVTPRKIYIDVALTVARTKRQAPGSFFQKINSHEGRGIWAIEDIKGATIVNTLDAFVNTKFVNFADDDLAEVLDNVVKEWGLRLIEMV